MPAASRLRRLPKRRLYPRRHALTTTEVGLLLQVTTQTVGVWTATRGLKCWRTAGGHRRIYAEDLRDFVLAHNMPLTFGLTGAKR